MGTEKGAMEDWVDMCVRWEIESIGDQTNAFNNLKWAKEALREFWVARSGDRRLSSWAQLDIYPLPLFEGDIIAFDINVPLHSILGLL